MSVHLHSVNAPEEFAASELNLAAEPPSPVPTRREILRRERARLRATSEPGASPEDGPSAQPSLAPVASPSELPSPDALSVPVVTSWERPEGYGTGPRSGRRRATGRSGGSIANLPGHVTDLLFVLQTRPWLFLDVVDLVILTGSSREEVSGGLELLADQGLIRAATRGNRVCYAAVP